jgi:Eukaryotic mitochondrial regulator protein
LVRRGVTPRVLDEGQENHSPFPGNQSFVSQPILSEEVRDDIWKRIMQDGQSVRDVSVTLGVDMRRVAAVVRLKEVEKEWLRIVSSPIPSSAAFHSSI